MTILRNNPCNGTVGNTVVAAPEGATNVVNTLTYVTGGFDGAQAVQGAANATAYIQNTVTGAYTAFYLRLPSATTADNTVVLCLDGSSTVVAMAGVISGGALRIWTGPGVNVGTTTATLTTGTWYRLEYRVDATGQELRLYTATGSTPIETISGVITGTTAPDRWRHGHPSAGKRGGVVDLDQINIADAWPNLGSASYTDGPAVAATATVTAAGVRATSGAAAIAATAGVTAAGVRATTGAAATSPAVAVTAAGTVSKAGDGDRATVVDVSATGTLGLSSSGAQAVSSTGSADGVVGRAGAAGVALSVAVTAAGSISAGVTGTGDQAATVTITADGQVTRTGLAAATPTVTTTAAGDITRPGSADQATDVAVTATGHLDLTQTAPVSIDALVTAAGVVQRAILGPAPASRTLAIPAQVRALEVDVDERVLVVAATARTHQVPAEPRVELVAAEPRTLSIGGTT